MKVLVVEDSSEDRLFIIDALAGSGLDVCCVETAEEARNRLQHDRYDFLVVDFHLPLESGLDLLRSLPTPAPQAILVSGILEAQVVHAAHKMDVRVIEKRGKWPTAVANEIARSKNAPGLDGALRPVVVGRGAQLATLRTVLESARAGHGQLVYLRGDEGIGKTTLANEVTRVARELGMLTLRASCESEGSAYAPWFRIHTAYRATTRRETPVDALLARVAHAPEAWDVDLEQAQHARCGRFHRMWDWLCSVADEQPLVLILDDLQAADTGSIDFLDYVAAHVPGYPMVVLGAYRPHQASVDKEGLDRLDEIGLERGALVLNLPAFSIDEIHEYLEGALARPVDRDVAAALAAKCDGHPRTLAEILWRLVTEHSGLADVSPECISELSASRLGTVNRRLHRMGDANLVWLAVMGLCERLDQQRVCDAAESDAPLAAVEEALRYRIIVEDAPGELRFYYELLREAAVERLTPSDRCVWHAALGEAIERRHAPDLEPHLSVLARHFLEAGPTCAAKAIDYACRAGHRLARLLACREAARFYEDALRVDDRARYLSPVQRVDLLIRWSQVLWRCGDFPAARRVGWRAYDAARILPDVDARLRAALGIAGPIPGYGAIIKTPDVAEVLDRALAEAGSAGSALRPLVQARLADELAFSPHAPRARALAREALTLARANGDLVVEAGTLRLSMWTIWMAPHSERAALLARMDELATERRDPGLELYAKHLRVLVELEAGDFAGARQTLTGCATMARTLRVAHPLWLAKVTEACVEISMGRLEEGLSLASDAAALGQQCGNPNAAIFHGVQRNHVMWLRGRSDFVLQTLSALEAQVPALGKSTLMGRAITLLDIGRLQEAREAVESLGADPLTEMPRDVTRAMNLAYLGEIAARTGLRDTALRVMALLRPFETGLIVVPPLFAYGPVAHHLGTMASWLGQDDAAREWFERALALEARGPLPHWRARTLVEMAHAAVRCDAREYGRKLLDEARRTIESLGLESLGDRAQEVARLSRAPRTIARRLCRLQIHPKEFWVSIDGRTMKLKLIDGFKYIVELLRNEGRWLSVVDLYERAKGTKVLRVSWAGGPGTTKKVQETVRQGFKLALDRLRSAGSVELSELTTFFERHIRTGFQCCFFPDPAWEFEL